MITCHFIFEDLMTTTVQGLQLAVWLRVIYHLKRDSTCVVHTFCSWLQLIQSSFCGKIDAHNVHVCLVSCLILFDTD